MMMKHMFQFDILSSEHALTIVIPQYFPLLRRYIAHAATFVSLELYVNRPHTLEELQARIRTEMRLPPPVFSNCMRYHIDTLTY